MKIVLYDIQHGVVYSYLTAIVTGSSITHASVIQDDINYDTTLKRGYFHKATSLEDYPDRLVTVFDIPDTDCSEWIKENLGVKYDTLGLLLWPLNFHSKNKFFCFEVAIECLKYTGVCDFSHIKGNPSGKDIVNVLTSLGYVGQRTKIKYILPN